MEVAVKQNNTIAAPKKQGNFFGKESEAPFFAPVFIQPKLTIGPVDDPYEREADAVADKVMRMSDTAILHAKSSPVAIQRKCEACEEEEEKIQRKCTHCEDEEKILMKGEASATGGIAAPPIVNNVINSTGQPLDSGTRRFMESRFGYDFGNVQVHNDSLAHQSSSEINALAYMHGNHVVFGAGQYQPNTSSGKYLLAHELAHTLQQNKNNHLQRQPVHHTPAGAAGAAFIINQPYKKGEIELEGGETVYIVLDLSSESKVVQLGPPYLLAYKPFEISTQYLEPSPFADTGAGNQIKASEIFQSETKDEFVERIYKTAIDRCTKNIANLNAWKAYLDIEFRDAMAVRDQIMGIMANELFEQGTSRGKGYEFENWCRIKAPNQRKVYERIMTGEIHGGCQNCHDLNFAWGKDMELLEKTGLKDFNSFPSALESLQAAAVHSQVWQKNKDLLSDDQLINNVGKAAQQMQFANWFEMNENQPTAPVQSLKPNVSPSTSALRFSMANNYPVVPVVNQKTELFCPEPEEESSLESPAMENMGPCSKEAYKAIQQIHIKLEKLGPWPKGYGVLPTEIFTSLYNESPENIRGMVMQNIDIRISKLENRIAGFNNKEPEYYKICAIVNELWSTTNEKVRKIIKLEKILREMQEKVDAANMLGLTILSFIFPPLGLVVAGISMYESYKMYKEGVAIEEAKGAGVFTLSQEASADSMKSSGIMGMVMGAISMGMTAFTIPKWISAVQRAQQANKILQSLRALEDGGILTIPGVPGTILSKNGRLLFFNENKQLIGYGMISKGEIWITRLQSPVDIYASYGGRAGGSMVPYAAGPMVPYTGGPMGPVGNSMMPFAAPPIAPFSGNMLVGPSSTAGPQSLLPASVSDPLIPTQTPSPEVYVTGAIPGKPSSGTIHVIRNGQEATFSRTNRTISENIGRNFLAESSGNLLSVEEMQGKRILDIAAGTEGLTVQQLRMRGIEAYGMDIALSPVPEQAPSLPGSALVGTSPGQYLMRGDIINGIPFTGKFDIIYELYGGISYGIAATNPQVIPNILDRLTSNGVLYLAPLDPAQQRLLENLIPVDSYNIQRSVYHAQDEIWRISRK